MHMAQAAPNIQTGQNAQTGQIPKIPKKEMNAGMKKFFRGLWLFCKFAWLTLIIVIVTGLIVSILISTPDSFGGSIFVTVLGHWLWSPTVGCSVVWGLILLLLVLTLISALIVQRVGTNDEEANTKIKSSIDQLSKAITDFQAPTGPIGQLTTTVEELKTVTQHIGQTTNGKIASLSLADLDQFFDRFTASLQTSIGHLAQKNADLLTTITEEHIQTLRQLMIHHEETAEKLLGGEQTGGQVPQQAPQKSVGQECEPLQSVQATNQTHVNQLQSIQEPDLEQEESDHTQKAIICPQCGYRNRAGAKFCKKDGYLLRPAFHQEATEGV